MKKIIIYNTLILMSFLMFSCETDHTDFSGKWIDKEKQSEIINITKNGKNYIVETRGKKFPANVNADLLEISAELPIKATIDDNDNLIVGGSEYVRFENSELHKYIGNWKSDDGKCVSEMKIKLDEQNKIEIEFKEDMAEGAMQSCCCWGFENTYFKDNTLISDYTNFSDGRYSVHSILELQSERKLVHKLFERRNDQTPYHTTIFEAE